MVGSWSRRTQGGSDNVEGGGGGGASRVTKGGGGGESVAEWWRYSDLYLSGSAPAVSSIMQGLGLVERSSLTYLEFQRY